MQINRLQSPNFGMALKIDNKAAANLKKSSLKVVENLREIGNELKDHQYVDMHITETLSPVVRPRNCGNAYYDFFKPTKVDGSGLIVNTRWAGPESANLKRGDNYSVYVKFADEKAAEAAYERLSKAGAEGSYTREAAAEFTKALEESYAYKAQVAAAEKAMAQELDKATSDLLSEFGVSTLTRQI